MAENIELIQLSPNSYVIAFSRKSLAALKNGKATGVIVKTGFKKLKFIFMRDSTYREQMHDFEQLVVEELRNTAWWKRWWRKMFGHRKHLALLKSPNMTTRDIK